MLQRFLGTQVSLLFFVLGLLALFCTVFTVLCFGDLPRVGGWFANEDMGGDTWYRIVYLSGVHLFAPPLLLSTYTC
jgi:hypothetical protein